jgi:hypothetical protein
MRSPLLLPILIILLAASTGQAQTYYRFPDSNMLWTIHYSPRDDSEFRMQYIALKAEDTIISSVRYHKIFRSTDTTFNAASYVGGIREDSARRVWLLLKQHGTATNNEIVLFDFSRHLGDTLKGTDYNNHNNWGIPLIVSAEDSILIGSSYRKRLVLMPLVPTADWYLSAWVEGIGNVGRGPLFSSGTFPFNGIRSDLMCVRQDGNWIYHNSQFADCMTLQTQGVNQQAVSEVKVFPAVAQDYISIINARGCSATLYDLTGRKLIERAITADGERMEVAGLAPGMYLVGVRHISGQRLIKRVQKL